MKTNPKLRDLLIRITALRKKADLIYGLGEFDGFGAKTPKDLYLQDLDKSGEHDLCVECEDKFDEEMAKD